MPLYEYECRKCHHRFEEIQQFSDPPIKKCPKCGSKRVDKLPSAPAVQFKGSGWYVTDYARKGTSSALPDHGEGGKDKAEKESAAKSSDKESSGKESGGKESSSKESGGKESSSRESGGKESSGKEPGSGKDGSSRKGGRKD